MSKSFINLIFLFSLFHFTSLASASTLSPCAITLTSSVTQPTCFSSNDGKIAISVSSGVAPFSAKWTSNTGFTSTNLIIVNLAPGNYSIEVSDSKGDIGIISNIKIEAPTPLIASVEVTDVLCYGEKSGSISFEAEGGTTPYQYSLDGIDYQASNKFLNLKSGGYTAFVKDKNGCLIQRSSVINEPFANSLDLGSDTLAYFDQSIYINTTFNGPASNLLIEWSGSSLDYLSCTDCLDPTVGPIDKSLTYTISVIDENGCQYVDEIRILLNKYNTISVPTGFTPNGDGVNDLLLVFGPKETVIRDFRIYDRQGSMIYQFSNYLINSETIGWNGKTNTGGEAHPGSYLWTIEVLYPSGELKKQTGSTTLIR